MKDIELRILKRYNDLQDPPLEAAEDRYSRFDAINHKEIAEIKFRKKHYAETLIEFDKYAFNSMYGKIWNRDFLYIVGDPTGVYVFNITLLNLENYDFRWDRRKMPEMTEFESSGSVKKIVGFIDWERSWKKFYGSKNEKGVYI